MKCLCVTFFRMFVTTLVFARNQEAVAQDAKAITTKEREEERSSKAMSSMACKRKYNSKISP